MASRLQTQLTEWWARIEAKQASEPRTEAFRELLVAWEELRAQEENLAQKREALAASQEALEEAEEALRQPNATLDAQVRERTAAVAVLLRETHHRMKNNFQVIASLLDLHADASTDPPRPHRGERASPAEDVGQIPTAGRGQVFYHEYRGR